MKNILKTKYISFLLALVMVVGIFLPHSGALAEGSGKYNIELQIDVKDKDDYSKHDFKKDSLFIKPSGRQVKVYKLNIEGDLSEEQMIELASKYDAYKAEDFKKLIDEKKINEGFLSEKSKLKYGKTTYDEIDTSKIKDFDYSKLSEEILIKDLPAGYYLIKETDESAKILKEKLATNVVKLPSKEVKDKVLLINAKQVRKVKTKQIKLFKVDANNKDVKLDKAEFELYKKAEKDGEKDQQVNLTGDNGVYYRNDEKGAHIALKTWNGGKIEVYNLLEGTYYFKEIKPAPGYPEEGNKGKVSKNLKLGESDTVDNKPTPILKKVDKDTGKALDGAVFELYKKDGTKLNFKETSVGYEQDPNGKAKLVTKNGGILNITNLANGEYTIKEVEAPKGYKQADIKEDFKVNNFNAVDKDGKLRILVIKNEPLTPPPVKTPKGGFNFVKIDCSKEEHRLANAKFILMKKSGETYERVLVNGKEVSLTSKDNGEFSIDGLEYGEYALKEVKAPDNYVIVNELTPFTVDAASSSLPAKKIVNMTCPPVKIVSKDNTITTKYVPGNITTIVKNTNMIVKTGDIRIIIMSILGLILLAMGIKLVKSGERLQRV